MTRGAVFVGVFAALLLSAAAIGYENQIFAIYISAALAAIICTLATPTGWTAMKRIRHNIGVGWGHPKEE